jgi:hypothetical protein
MRSLLDEMLYAMAAGPVIVSEQHDTSNIGGSAAADLERRIAAGRGETVALRCGALMRCAPPGPSGFAPRPHDRL